MSEYIFLSRDSLDIVDLFHIFSYHNILCLYYEWHTQSIRSVNQRSLQYTGNIYFLAYHNREDKT